MADRGPAADPAMYFHGQTEYWKNSCSRANKGMEKKLFSFFLNMNQGGICNASSFAANQMHLCKLFS